VYLASPNTTHQPSGRLTIQIDTFCINMKVQDAVCLVTGSAQGLGKAFAVRLLAAGAKVCISDVREEGGLATLTELQEKFGIEKVTFVQCDVTKPEQFSKYALCSFCFLILYSACIKHNDP